MPISNVGGLQFFHIICLFYYSHPSSCEVVVSLVLLICIFLMTNNVEHLDMHLLAICISLEKCLFISYDHF